LSLENQITHIKSTPEAGNEHRQVNQAFHRERLYWIFCPNSSTVRGARQLTVNRCPKSLSQKLAYRSPLSRTDIIVTCLDGNTGSKPVINNLLSSAASPNTLARQRNPATSNLDGLG
jgi:hypothetical protein